MILFEHSKPYELGLQPEQLKGFKDYLSEAWKNRKTFTEYIDIETEDDNEQIEINNQKQCFLKFDGSKVSSGKYVGFIKYGDLKIEIYPKVFRQAETPTISECQAYLKQILYWLKYCSKIRFPFSQINPELMDSDNFLELFIYIFANYSEKLISESPFQAYEEINEETGFIKGRLNFPAYINENIVTARWHKFNCTYQPFIYDNLFNQIIKCTANLLLQITQNQSNREKLQSIMFILDEVTFKNCLAEECDKVKLNPFFEELEIVLNMCRMFLSNQTISNSEENKSNFCFLLPMDYVFEDFLYGFIKTHLPRTRSAYQKSDLYLTKDRIFNLQHDIYLNDPPLIIDAKYKMRNYLPGDNKAGVSQADMYQMLSYSIRRDCTRALLIYPQDNSNKEDIRNFYIKSNMFNDQEIKITAINIPFANISEQSLIESLEKVIYSVN